MNPGSSIDEAEDKKASNKVKVTKNPKITGRKFIRASRSSFKKNVLPSVVGNINANILTAASVKDIARLQPEFYRYDT
jgi:hypothetical protein